MTAESEHVLFTDCSFKYRVSFLFSNVCVSPVLLKGLQELMSSSQTSPGPGSPSSSALQIRLTRLEESGGGGGGGSPAPSSVAALQIPLQIPLQITHLGETP